MALVAPVFLKREPKADHDCDYDHEHECQES
jgi:hypothetical protein